MDQSLKRNTVQRELVLNAVHSLGNHPTSEQVYLYISKTHPSISKSTIYRNLDKLCENGELLRVPVTQGAFHVDHTLKPHHHMCCKRCGKVYDVQTNEIGDLKRNITDTNGCLITDYYVVFNGLCPECNKLNEN
ncbi:MAG: transcriptional repressor [Clostridiales bacterium]|nr:MAG: transcriptional repressor [Clostridiales bacterium]